MAVCLIWLSHLPPSSIWRKKLQIPEGWQHTAQKGARVRSEISVGYIAPRVTLPHLFWIWPCWEAVGYLFLQTKLHNPVCACGKEQRWSACERVIIGAFVPFSHLFSWPSPAMDLHRKMPLYAGTMSIDGRTNYCIDCHRVPFYFLKS